MKPILVAALLFSFGRVSTAQQSFPPPLLTAICPGSLAASSAYPTEFSVTVLGTDFDSARTDLFLSDANQKPDPSFSRITVNSSTQVTLFLKGSEMTTPRP